MNKEEYLQMVHDDYIQSSTKCLSGALPLHRDGWLNFENATRLLSCVDRAERMRDPIVYCKAIRATLLALGFKPAWVEGSFRTLLEEYFLYDKDNQA